MRTEAITLVLAMAVATVLTAACDKPPVPETRQSSAPVSSVPAETRPAPSVAAASERKDGQPPVQGDVDPKQAAQRRDYQGR